MTRHMAVTAYNKDFSDLCLRSHVQIYASLHKTRQAALKTEWNAPFRERKIWEASETRTMRLVYRGHSFSSQPCRFGVVVLIDPEKARLASRIYCRFPRRRLAFSRWTTTTTTAMRQSVRWTMTRLKSPTADAVYGVAYQVISRHHFWLRIYTATRYCRVFGLRMWILRKPISFSWSISRKAIVFHCNIYSLVFDIYCKSRVYFKVIFIISRMHEDETSDAFGRRRFWENFDAVHARCYAL